VLALLRSIDSLDAADKAEIYTQTKMDGAPATGSEGVLPSVLRSRDGVHVRCRSGHRGRVGERRHQEGAEHGLRMPARRTLSVTHELNLLEALRSFESKSLEEGSERKKERKKAAEKERYSILRVVSGMDARETGAQFAVYQASP